MRGRLLRYALAEILQLDTLASSANYNRAFRTTVRQPPASGEGAGTDARQNHAPSIKIKAQVEDDQFQDEQEVATGDSPSSKVVLVFHRRNLEQDGLIDENGLPTIHKQDQLVALYDRRGQLIQRYLDPLLFAREVRPYGPGIGGSANLVLAVFVPRPRGLRSAT